MRPTIVNTIVKVVESGGVDGENTPGCHQKRKGKFKVQFHNYFKRRDFFNVLSVLSFPQLYSTRSNLQLLQTLKGL
jgi:hypothetical protein